MAQKRPHRPKPKQPKRGGKPPPRSQRRSETSSRAGAREGVEKLGKWASSDAENLTKAQARLLTVFADPQHLKCLNDELAALADISRAQFYRLMSDPLMRRRRYELIQEQLSGIMGGVVHAAWQSALIPGKEGAADRKLLMETSGVYVPASKQIHELKGPLRMEGDMPDEELVYLYLACKMPPERWLPGVRQRYDQGLITPKRPETGPMPVGAQV